MNMKYEDNYRKLGLKIAYYRKLKGYTQEQLAEGVEMSQVFISQIEAPNSYVGISLDTLFSIADYLGTSPCKFLDFDND